MELEGCICLHTYMRMGGTDWRVPLGAGTGDACLGVDRGVGCGHELVVRTIGAPRPGYNVP